MFIILKREVKNYLKNPVLWIGLIIVIFLLYQNLGSYLKLHYVRSESELEEVHIENKADADISEGYIPSAKNKQWELASKKIKDSFVESLGYSEKQAQAVINKLEKENMTEAEMSAYLVKNYDFYGADQIFQDTQTFKATKKEMNSYLNLKLRQKPFTYYFARKFADFAGLCMGFFAAVLLAFLFIRDTKRDTYEMLHTKPVSAVSYIMGKVLGGFLTLMIILTILNMIFGTLCAVYGWRAGFPVRIWDLLWASLLYIVPNMLMIVSVYTAAAVIFKNPLPAAPLLFLYMIYSNMGSIGPDGQYGYYGKPLAVMVRFPGKFFETAPPPGAFINQIILILASAMLIFSAAAVWKKWRSY